MKCTKYITPADWLEVSTYLFVDLKLSRSKGSSQSIRSRFFILAKNFSDKPLTRDNFNKFIADMQDKGYKPSYINGFIKLAKHIDKYYKLNQLTDYTYFHEVKQHMVDIFTPEEIRAIAELKINYRRWKDQLNQRYRCLYYLLGLTGMRIQELLNLTWGDFFGDYLIIRYSKNGEQRVVPIPAFLSKLLNLLPRIGNSVFNIKTPQEINHDLKRRCAKLGIIKQQISVHVFRHSFITTMLKQNQASIIQIARIVGHKKIESTNLYSHMLIEDLKLAQATHPLIRQEEDLKSVAERLQKVALDLIDNERFKVVMKSASGGVSLTLCSKGA